MVPRGSKLSAITGEYLLAAEMEVPHSTGSVFLGLVIPRRSRLISILTCQILTTVGCHGVDPPLPPLFKFSIPWGRDFALLFRVYYPSLICEPVFFSLFSLNLPHELFFGTF